MKEEIASDMSTQEVAASGPGPHRLELPVMDGFSRAEFDALYAGPCKPVVIRNAINEWPALEKWNPEFFAREFGDTEVRPSVGLPDTEVPYFSRDVDHRKPMTMKAFVERMDSGDRCYLDQASLLHYFEALGKDFDFDTLNAKDIKAVSIWIGARTRSGLHYDMADNFFVQLYGSKKAILAAPEEARSLHLFKDQHTKSQVAPQSPDLKAHPKFNNATVWEATLDPGDVMFIPKAWWHYLASKDRSVSLNCWFGVPLGPDYDVKMLLKNNPMALPRTVRDFVWHGVLRRPCKSRLYSPPPTGLMLYELLSSRVFPKRQKKA